MAAGQLHHALLALLVVSAMPGICSASRRLQWDLLSAAEAVPKISNGILAKAGDFPYIAALFIRNQDPTKQEIKWIINCGGSLVAPNVVLTAAHCVAGQDLAKGYVQVGIVEKMNDLPKLQINSSVIHPKYDGYQLDVALVVLKSRVEGVPLSKLAPRDTRLVRSQKLTVTGFGMTPTAPFGADALMATTVEFVPYQDCRSRYFADYSDIPRSAMCTASLTRSSTCPGDSGGPVLTQDGVQVGIISFGTTRICGSAGSFDGHTDVRRVRRWINRELTRIARETAV